MRRKEGEKLDRDREKSQFKWRVWYFYRPMLNRTSPRASANDMRIKLKILCWPPRTHNVQSLAIRERWVNNANFTIFRRTQFFSAVTVHWRVSMALESANPNDDCELYIFFSRALASSRLMTWKAKRWSCREHFSWEYTQLAFKCSPPLYRISQHHVYANKGWDSSVVQFTY